MVLQFKNLEKSYGGRLLFEGVNLTLSPDEIVGVLGPSGKGKSTLLKIAAGLEKPTGGMARIDTRRIGYVFQEPRLMPWYSALDNIALALLPLGYSSSSARQRAGRFLEEMGLGGFESHFPETLSGGMKQRVSICRAMAISPKLMLLDEPFIGLDPDLRADVRRRMQKILAQSRAAVIHVTHDKDELLPNTSRIYTLTGRGLINAT
ncbi:MAG: nitrate ABC transporter ATP-binding protein [Desulfotalea sp.]|nr:MAG: nitrate ABC transporter ATP-binding protein [Desulfotalea sp.]